MHARQASAERPAGGTSLEVAGLTKRFGELLAVDGLSLQVRSGEVFGFLGPNGAGKTTAISMMCGLLRPDSGQTLVFGKPVAGGEPEVRARVGVCPQQVVLWPRLTCLEQLEFMGEAYDVPRSVARKRAEELLAAVGLTEKKKQLARTLSGGMQRRLSIVMALVHEPDIVVLDEPEAGLDPQSRVLVREYLAALAREKHKTVILTTHNMDEAERVVDRVAIIDHGKVLEVDTPLGLKQRVGRGDTLELSLSGGSSQAQQRLAQALPGARVDASGLTLNQLGLVERIPAVLDQVKQLGFTVGRLQLRESTLEDVFLTLTGRRLRE